MAEWQAAAMFVAAYRHLPSRRDRPRASPSAGVGPSSLTSRASGLPFWSGGVLSSCDAAGMADALVDVIIPTYQRADLTARAVASVRAQTDDRWRLILADDGSSPSVIEQLRTLCDDSVILIESPSNLGPQAARQRAFQRGDAPWVALLDSDDEWKPQKLSRQLDASDGVDVVLCRHRWVGDLPKPVNDLAGEGILAPRFTANMSIPLIRRAAIERAGGMQPPGPSLRTGENVEFYVRLAGLPYRVVAEHLVDCWSHSSERASDGFTDRSAGDGMAWIADHHAAKLALWPQDHGEILGRAAARYFAAGLKREGWRYLWRAVTTSPQPTSVMAKFGPTALRRTFTLGSGSRGTAP